VTGPARRGVLPRGASARVGAIGEELACEHLRRRGFRVLARNVRTRAGEIDVIAFDGRTLAFVEVKTASAGATQASAPLERLGPRQRARLRRAAAAWLCRGAARPHAPLLRLDAIGVTVDSAGRLLRLDHVESAW
jgi:putative endonuclease